MSAGSAASTHAPAPGTATGRHRPRSPPPRCNATPRSGASSSYPGATRTRPPSCAWATRAAPWRRHARRASHPRYAWRWTTTREAGCNTASTGAGTCATCSSASDGASSSHTRSAPGRRVATPRAGSSASRAASFGGAWPSRSCSTARQQTWQSLNSPTHCSHRPTDSRTPPCSTWTTESASPSTGACGGAAGTPASTRRRQRRRAQRRTRTRRTACGTPIETSRSACAPSRHRRWRQRCATPST